MPFRRLAPFALALVPTTVSVGCTGSLLEESAHATAREYVAALSERRPEDAYALLTSEDQLRIPQVDFLDYHNRWRRPGNPDLGEVSWAEGTWGGEREIRRLEGSLTQVLEVRSAPNDPGDVDLVVQFLDEYRSDRLPPEDVGWGLSLAQKRVLFELGDYELITMRTAYFERLVLEEDQWRVLLPSTYHVLFTQMAGDLAWRLGECEDALDLYEEAAVYDLLTVRYASTYLSVPRIVSQIVPSLSYQWNLKPVSELHRLADNLAGSEPCLRAAVDRHAGNTGS